MLREWEYQPPSPFYWFKVGVAFSLGAGAVYVLSAVAWVLLLRAVPDLYVLRAMRIL